MTPLDDANGVAVISIQEAEFAVQSSIAVREEYKRKLKALLEAISLETSQCFSHTRIVSGSIAATTSQPWAKTKTKSSVKKPTATTTKSSECPRIPQGKEMHVLGDWLLLVRAASVNVVEKVQTWRRVVHQGKPQPFHHSHDHETGGNYLLTMCEDLDFLNNSVDLVEWLGFHLARNPFIVHGALDDVMAETLSKTSVHSVRSLKYWSSASWQKQKKYQDKRKKARGGPECDHLGGESSPFDGAANSDSNNNTAKTRSPQQWRARRPPPQALTKPLVGILPEDDVIDGTRIEAAQRVLLEEEAFHGRLQALRAIRQYLVDVSSSSDVDETENGDGGDSEQPARSYASVYDEIADLTTQIKRLEVRFTLNERERNQVLLTIEDLENQILWTQNSRELDLTKDHGVWRWRESYYKESNRVYSVLADKLSKRLEVLTESNNHAKALLEKQHDHLTKLLREKDKQRVERHGQKRREEELRRAEIRQKTVARTTKIKAKKQVKSLGSTNTETQGIISSTTLSGAQMLQEVEEIVNQHALIPRENTATRSHAQQLEQKRLAAILQRDSAREAHTRAIADAASELDRRRSENVRMRLEDELASALERLARKKQRLRDLKMRLERIASTPVFTCVQQLSGKKQRVAIYEQRARGYILDGLRVVAYDPSSSSSFPLVMTTREYTSLGYGRTVEGFSAFCKWLCLLYEKRKRHFRLVWSGPPCPPPLRVREYDSVLCIHKEGLKLAGFGYFLVAVFVRPGACSKLHFVVSDLRSGKDSTCVENVVLASKLVHASALQVQRYGRVHDDDDSFVVWKHHQHYDSGTTGLASALAHSYDQSHDHHRDEIRVYSGEVRIHNRAVLVHVYDASLTEYVLEFHTPPTKKSPTRKSLTACSNESAVVTRITLVKHEVNPYDVRLPSSAFSDLVASIDLAQLTDSSGSAQSPPIVTPKWMEKLTKYVRVLKMTKFALKIDRKFFFVTLSIVQQKTEFRSYMLLELSCASDMGLTKKQSLRISLSEYLRCVNASRRILPIDSAEDEECKVCERATNLHQLLSLKDYGEVVAVSKSPGSCLSCATIQNARLLTIRNLVTADHHLNPVDMAQIDYHGHCQACGTLAKPVLVVLNYFTTAAAAGLLQLLGYHFSCFDMAAVVADDELRQAIDVERIVVLFNADCGTTTAAASEFVHELHGRLYPELHHETQQLFHAVFLVDNRVSAGHTWRQISTAAPSRDQDVAEALEALAAAAGHVGDQEPIVENSEVAAAHEDAFNFDAYLVTEALLVEATLVVLQPEMSWRKPGETVGASSWSAAGGFLADPRGLSLRLQLVRLSLLPLSAHGTLDSYFSHPKWPHNYEDVRPIFHALLCFMMHVSHIQHIVRGRSGILQDASTREIGFLDGSNGDRNDEISVISLESRPEC